MSKGTVIYNHCGGESGAESGYTNYSESPEPSYRQPRGRVAPTARQRIAGPKHFAHRQETAELLHLDKDEEEKFLVNRDQQDEVAGQEGPCCPEKVNGGAHRQIAQEFCCVQRLAANGAAVN